MKPERTKPDKNGPAPSSCRQQKKGISEKRPVPCIPPVTRRLRTNVSPRKRSSGPLDGGFQCRHRESSSCPGFPRFRDFRARTAYAGERNRSPSRDYYTMPPCANQTEKHARPQEKTPPHALSSRCSSLLYKIGVRQARKPSAPRMARPRAETKQKPHPGTNLGCGWFCELFSTR